MNVSSVDFNSLNFAFLQSNWQGQCGYLYNGPQFELSKIVAATAAQGGILPMDAPGNRLNASYTSHFDGPSLKCSDVLGSLRSEILNNVNATSFKNTSFDRSYGYLSWAPKMASRLPFVVSDDEGPMTISQTLGPRNGGPLALYVATFPQMQNVYKTDGLRWTPGYYDDATIVECHLTNATYTASFNWTNGIRDMDISVAAPTSDIYYSNAIDCTRFLYMPDVPSNFSLSTDLGALSMYNNTIIQRYAYQAVMHAFGQLLAGTISHARVPQMDVATTVMNTPVGAVRELNFLRANNSDGLEVSSFLTRPNSSLWPGVSVPQETNSSSTLRTTLEELFQNITLSLMTAKSLQ